MTDQKLNVALVASPVGKAGVEIITNFIELFRAICGHLYVVTGNFPEDRFADDNVHILNIKNNEKEKPLFMEWLLGFMLRQIRFSVKLLAVSSRVDTVVLTTGRELVLPVVLTRLLRKRLIVVTTGSLTEAARVVRGRRSPLYGLTAAIEKTGYALSDRISCYSPCLIPQLGLDKYRSKIFPGARFVDTRLFKPTQSHEQRKTVIGFAGKLIPPKGIMNFVQAMPLISSEHKDVEFLICGDGFLSDEVKREVRNTCPGTKVTFTGWTPHDKLPDYFNEMKLLVFPSYVEGLPNIVLEAMACGTPVLSTPVGSVPDLIKDGETGFVLEENTGRGIARSVSRALGADLSAISINSRNLIEKEYTFAAAAARYRAILYDSEVGKDGQTASDSM